MYYIGIDLGGTGAQAGIVNESGQIIAKGSVPTQAHAGYEAIVKDMAELTLGVLKDADISLDEIKSIGIGGESGYQRRHGR